jgi:aspartyl-tRNA(Asn)/glutamyl-tRNA(Gln) amidotransferase subunit A
VEALYERSRSEGFGDEVKRRIMIGTFALSAGYHDAYYGRAMRARELVRGDYAEAFARVDALLSPVAPVPPFRLGERAGDPLAMYLVDAMTVPANLAGVPAISVPLPPTAASDSPGARLPAGLQIQAPRFEEGRLFRVAAAWEALAGPADPPADVADGADPGAGESGGAS